MEIFQTSGEDVHFIRHPEMDGLELRRVDDSCRNWVYFSRGYQFLVSASWSGLFWHRQREFSVAPGDALAVHPGDLVVTRGGRGTLYCVTLGEDSYTQLNGGKPVHCGLARAANHLAHNLVLGLVRTAQEQGCPEELQARVVGFLNWLRWCKMAESDFDGAKASRQAEQLLRRIESMEDAADLDTLGALIGRSRFSALRAFKRQFGLPPSSYQIHLRVEHAQRQLRAGHPPARVAADCGFFDQSHLTRHFKRVLGTTPAQYARAGVRRRSLLARSS